MNYSYFYIFVFAIVLQILYHFTGYWRKEEGEKRKRILEGSPSFVNVISRPENDAVQEWRKEGLKRIEKEQAKPGKIIFSYIIPFLFLTAIGILFRFFFFILAIPYLFLITPILTFLSVFSKRSWYFSFLFCAFEGLAIFHMPGNLSLLFFYLSFLAILKRFYVFFRSIRKK